MNSAKQLLLPLYLVRKQSRRFSEKNLIFILLATTVFSLYFILRYLPTNVNIRENEGLNDVFIPKRVRYAEDKLNHNHSKVIHKEGDEHHKHEFKKFDNQDVNNKKNFVKPLIEKKKKTPKTKTETNNEDEENERRREKVKEMTLHAWAGYKNYAWGKNELRPISKQPHSPGIFGSAEDLGATLVDSMDTLYIMGFKEEVKEALKWIKEHFNIHVSTQMSAFEVNIRFVGGFLAMYSLTKDKYYVELAEDVAKSFFSIFNTQTGIPYSLFNPTNTAVNNYNWASGSCSILAEFGSFSLEFQYLTDITGNMEYVEKINKIYKTLEAAHKENGLYYNYFDPNKGVWCGKEASIGGLADSFYEYLLKHWVLKAKKDESILKTYHKSILAIREHLLRTSSKNLTFIGEYHGGGLNNKMGHLACFSGGLFALTAMNSPSSLSIEEIEDYKNLAIDITHTCHESYIKTPTRLGPESFGFNGGDEPTIMDRYYILRPEVMESYFYLWRMTKDKKYRDWAWDMVQALEKYCRSDSGYSGLSNVSNGSSKDDVQQSFFLAETLKYLFLIFSDDDVIPLDKFVFNTEAHPFLIKKDE